MCVDTETGADGVVVEMYESGVCVVMETGGVGSVDEVADGEVIAAGVPVVDMAPASPSRPTRPSPRASSRAGAAVTSAKSGMRAMNASMMAEMIRGIESSGWVRSRDASRGF